MSYIEVTGPSRLIALIYILEEFSLTNALHIRIGVAELFSKFIVCSNQSTHHTLIIPQEKKGLAAGGCINPG